MIDEITRRLGDKLVPMAGMIASVIFYAGGVVLLTGLAGLIHPIGPIGLRTRKAAVGISLAGLIASIAAIAWPPPRTRHAATAVSRLDELMPAWQFNERHSIHVAASPERVFKAIRDVRADEITLFRLLVWIRRAGRSGPESILNPSAQKSLLDVATSSGFVVLADDTPRELVIGTVISAPEALRRRGSLSADLFTRALPAGFTLALMNFLVTPDGRGGSVVSTETRVFSNADRPLRAFTTYWRIIHPGSDIIRRMWLRAIRARAER